MHNLKLWPDDQDLISKTLDLLHDMAQGYSSSKLLRTIEKDENTDTKTGELSRARRTSKLLNVFREPSQPTTFFHHAHQTRKKEREEVDVTMVFVGKGFENVVIQQLLEAVLL